MSPNIAMPSILHGVDTPHTSSFTAICLALHAAMPLGGWLVPQSWCDQYGFKSKCKVKVSRPNMDMLSQVSQLRGRCLQAPCYFICFVPVTP